MGSDFENIRSAYLIGIKGVGMTALAQILQARGVRVSGSDTTQHFFTDEVLRRAGIPCAEGFAAENVPADIDLVIRSTAYGPEHIEVSAAAEQGILITTYPETIAEVFNSGNGIAICGTHGKTTTTALLGHVLAEAGFDPTVIVGSEVPQFGGNARIGHSDLVVLEADEYQDKLRYYQPYGVILTSIEYDHPDFFPTLDAYIDVFRRFVRRISEDGFLVACADDPIVMEVAKEARCLVISYGLKENYSLIRTNKRIDDTEIILQIPGRHNVQNALGVLAAAERLGVSRDVALRALTSFQGAKRRFEIVGEVGGITVIDDYGHHPTEIRVTLAGARERYPGRRIICAFHAHTFSRTIALKNEFATAFKDADRTFVMNIFGSARELPNNFSPSQKEGERVREAKNASHEAAVHLASAINAYSPAEASGGVEETVEALCAVAQPGDVVICMGAGENDHVAREVVQRLTPRVYGVV